MLLDAKINVLLDTKSKAASLTEIPPQQLVLIHLQATQSSFSPRTCQIARDLLITPDPKRSDTVPCCNVTLIIIMSIRFKKITLGEHR
jgi:hypothetical protein